MKKIYKYIVTLFWLFVSIFAITKYFYSIKATGDYKKDILMLLFGITLLFLSIDRIYKEYRKK